jgi:hypothetical protein
MRRWAVSHRPKTENLLLHSILKISQQRRSRTIQQIFGKIPWKKLDKNLDSNTF